MLMQPEVKFVRALLWMLAGALTINGVMAAVVYEGTDSGGLLFLGAVVLVIVLLWTRPKGDKS